MQKIQLPNRSRKYGIGKEIGGAVYLHKSYESKIGDLVSNAKSFLPPDFSYTIVKVNLKNDAVSFINCADFDTADEPTLGSSYIVHTSGTIRKRNQPADPEIYHHKWLFVDDQYKGFDVEASKQRSIEWLSIPGIDRKKIGKRSYWLNEVAPLIENKPRTNSNKCEGTSASFCTGEQPQTIARHKTAIKRGSFSKPLKCLLRDGLLKSGKEYFDYGCGHGRDLDLLNGMNIACTGWDPSFRPNSKKQSADIVNIGYVINVIENPRERANALAEAWKLAKEVLCVAAQIEFAAPNKEQQAFGDGYLTSWGTFQKYYNQHELREYLQHTLETDAVSAAPGVFYLFKCEEVKQQFFATRFQRQYTVPRRRISEVLFDQNRELLEPFMEELTKLGRIPSTEEYAESSQIIEEFGSLKRAFKLIQKVTEESPWEIIAQKRSEDLLVYLALSRFGKRPPLSKLPLTVQKDIKVFLGGYRAACNCADALLFRVGDAEAIDLACQKASVGQLVENALIFHKSCLEKLEPLLRIYEGCARALVGELDDANVIKLHRFSSKVSYITYDEFDKQPHPVLKERMKISLRSLTIDWFDYSQWDDPYLLLEKHHYLSESYPRKNLFEKLSNSQRKLGITSQSNQLRKSELETIFQNHQLQMAGHRIVKNHGYNQ